MNKAISAVLNDKECGFYAETQGEFEMWLKELMGNDYRPPTTHNLQVKWDAHWQNKLMEGRKV